MKIKHLFLTFAAVLLMSFSSSATEVSENVDDHEMNQAVETLTGLDAEVVLQFQYSSVQLENDFTSILMASGTASAKKEITVVQAFLVTKLSVPPDLPADWQNKVNRNGPLNFTAETTGFNSELSKAARDALNC
jgi:hypothetical protein